jgi:prepilin-type N-terminal cleavage/methylation domain-containing protein
MPNGRRPVGEARGFTLLEMLLVVALIVLAVAMLLPALSGARVAARSLVCKSNLRQQGIAIQSYRNDHGSRYPMSVQNMMPDGTPMDPADAANVARQGVGWLTVLQPYLHVLPEPTDDGWANAITLLSDEERGFVSGVSVRRLTQGPLSCPEGTAPKNLYLSDVTHDPGVRYTGVPIPQYAYNQGFGYYPRYATSFGTQNLRWTGYLRHLRQPSEAVVVIDAWVGSEPITWQGNLLYRRDGNLWMWTASKYTFLPRAVHRGEDLGASIYSEYFACGGFRHVGRAANQLLADLHVNDFSKVVGGSTESTARLTLDPHVAAPRFSDGYVDYP